MPIGIIIWLILIVLIACTLPGYLPMLLALFAIAAGAFSIYAYICNRINKWQESEEYRAMDREKAIDAWEKKWKRTHPSRINRK